jgi:hypothetical protein
MDIADPSNNINRDGTVKENSEGTLTVCKCGAEFFLSFENGFLCGKCKKLKANKTAEKVREFLNEKNNIRSICNR